MYALWNDGQIGKPSIADNLKFFWNYQIKWMYWRYFMWNFSGRQNANQGLFSWDLRNGNWQSGIPLVDNMLLFNQQHLTSEMKEDKGKNHYYFLPLIFGFLGLTFQMRKRKKDALALSVLFLMTGIGIIIYSNQPPGEPRERDYVLIGSFLTFCLWIGLGAIYIYQKLQRIPMSRARIAIALGCVMIAPIIMGVQNYDDNNRRNLSAARDYAKNFLESCDRDAILFTFGDNDTYPLWYVQEVEKVRTDVRVVNLGLLSADWYIDQLRRKVNDSSTIKLTLPEEAYRGSNRSTLQYPEQLNAQPMAADKVLQFIGEDHPLPTQSEIPIKSYLPTNKILLPIDLQKALASGLINVGDQHRVVSSIMINIDSGRLAKDELALIDILYSNMYDRPIYFSMTTPSSKLLGLDDFRSMEGLAYRFRPVAVSDQGVATHVNAEKNYDLIMNTFQWGGFDKHDQFVTDSFLPSYYAHKNLIEQTAFTLLNNDQRQKSVDLADKYFLVFPHMNFPYRANIINLLRVYHFAGVYDKTKMPVEILLQEMKESLSFYASLRPEELENGFESDRKVCIQVLDELKRLALLNRDQNLVDTVDEIMQKN